MKTADRMFCEAIGRNRRAVAKLERRIQNSMRFHEENGTSDWPKWVALGEELVAMQKRDAEMTQELKDQRAEKRKAK